MQIAKIIDLSGSVINLSGYDALCKGMEADAAGKIERNGGCLVSKYYVMQTMKRVDVAGQEVIHFFSLRPLVELMASTLIMKSYSFFC
jgi:hypothetical protein